jgi:hypothetical protein
VWFASASKLFVSDAAQVNAVMSDAAASDDRDLRNIVHAGTTLIASALAVAERTGASGEDVLAAIVLGYEAAGRIDEAITPGFRICGFHGCLALRPENRSSLSCLGSGTLEYGATFSLASCILRLSRLWAPRIRMISRVRRSGAWCAFRLRGSPFSGRIPTRPDCNTRPIESGAAV